MGQKTEDLQARCRELGLKYVGFRGDPDSPIWQVGEAPGEMEERQGFPFVGYSGQLLDRLLKDAGIAEEDCCFTNPYKVRPPENKLSELADLGIPKEVYEEQFLEELFEYKPTFIVCNGATPLGVLCPDTKEPKGKPPLITKWIGSLLTSPKLPWAHYVIPNVHPAYVLRNWSERDTCLFVHRKVAEEFFYFKTHKILQPLPVRQLLYDPSFEESREYLFACLQAPYVSVDLELLARRVPIVVGLGYSSRHALSVELFDPRWTKEQLVWTWRRIDEILKNKAIIGQNFLEFDANWLDAMGFHSGVDRCHDTRVRHHVLHPSLSHSLQFMTMQYTRQPYYKDEGKGWTSKRGIAQLKRYNCLDVSVTYEVFENQEEEFLENPQLRKFYEEYELPLGRAFFKTDKRGILTDEGRRSAIRTEVTNELDVLVNSLSQSFGQKVVYKSLNTKEPVLNISSPKQLQDVLKNKLGIRLTIDRKTHKETTNEESLNKAYAETGNQDLKKILRIRELCKIRGTYIDAKMLKKTFYFSSSVTGTVGGRRSSKKNFLGYGSNAQNQPKHSDVGKKFREVYIARPGMIFIACDQIQAEDWIVQGIIADVSGDTSGVNELRSGVDRHRRLASQIFGLPPEQIAKDSMERYLGKKTRHAGNYGMEADKMAIEMAKEGYFLHRDFCAQVLRKFHAVEPNIRGVFHKYIEEQLNTTRILRTPFGRERTFFGLHPTRDNGKIYREAYSYIPQSTVGDNTGLAVLYLETNFSGHFLSEVHDSALLEVKNSLEAVLEGIHYMKEAFNRKIRFAYGFELRIPIEFELGFNLMRMEKCPGDVNEAGLRNTLNVLNQSQEALCHTSTGQP